MISIFGGKLEGADPTSTSMIKSSVRERERERESESERERECVRERV